MRKMSAESLVASLSEEGMTFTSSTMIHEGYYSSSDADWNYKDIPHLKELHNQVQSIATAIGDDIITTVFMQRLGPLQIPLTVVNYAIDRTSQTYYTTIGPFCLVIKTQWLSLDLNRTKVETTYNLGTTKLLKFLHGFAHRLLKNNYKTLMSADIPMRERRGFLRERGYTFRDDEIGYSFIRTLKIQENNLLNPRNEVSKVLALKIADIPEGRSTDGDLDRTGVVIIRKGNSLKIYERTCPHEGALLDKSREIDDCLRCPWHGRMLSPIQSIDDLNHDLTQLTDAGEWAINDGTLYLNRETNQSQ